MKRFTVSNYEFLVLVKYSRQDSKLHKATRCKEKFISSTKVRQKEISDNFKQILSFETRFKIPDAKRQKFGTQVSSLKCSIQVPDKFKDIMETPFDNFKDKITFGAIPDKRRLLLMQTDRIKNKSAFGTS